MNKIKRIIAGINLTDNYINSAHQSDEGYKDAESCYSAFTVAELGLMLPDNHLAIRTTMGEFSAWEYFKRGSLMPMVDVRTEAECRANILIYLLETGIIKPEEINQKLLNHTEEVL